MTLPGIGVFATGIIVRVIIRFLREKEIKIEAYIWGKTLTEISEAVGNLEIPFHPS